MPVTLKTKIGQETLPERGGRVPVSVEIEPGEQETAPDKRHVALCLDTSGSMRWQVDPGTPAETSKLEKLKSGLETALSGQLETDDYISVVSFASSPETVVPIENWGEVQTESFWEEIESLSAGGRTDVYGALEHAHEELRKAGDRGAVRRILLLTDGKHNPPDSEDDDPDFAGLATAIDESRVSIMTAGVGNDYDRHLMKQLADASQGNWHHLESESDFAEFVESELERIDGAVAVDPVLEVELNPQFGAYNFSRRVGGQPQSGDVTRTDSGTTVNVPLGDLVEGETQQVTFELTAPRQTPGREVSTATVRLRQGGTVLAETETAIEYVERGSLPGEEGDDEGDGPDGLPDPPTDTGREIKVFEDELRNRYGDRIQSAEGDGEFDEIEAELEQEREDHPGTEDTIDELLERLEAARNDDVPGMKIKHTGSLTSKDE